MRYALEAVTDLSQHAVEARELSSASRSILYLLLGTVGVPRGVLLRHDAAGALTVLAAKGRGAGPQEREPTRLRMGRGETAALARLPELLGAGDKRLPVALRNFVKEHGLTQVLPLVVRGRLAGVLALGNRLSGAALPPDAREVLETLGRYAAILLQQNELMQQLRAAVDENMRLCETLSDTYFSTVQAFSAAIDAKDVYTRGHSMRVARYSAALGTRLGLPHKTVAGIRIGAYLHDIGKIVLDRTLLNKPGGLSLEEQREIASHPVVGYDVLASVSFPWPEVRAVVRSHHERLDGRGYPDGLAGYKIPLPARILTVADAFDAMTSNRPYRECMAVEQALGELVGHSGTQFDPGVVRAFLEQCRDELEPGEKSGTPPGDGREARKGRARVLGPLLERAGAPLAAGLLARLLQTLGATPELQPA